MPKPDNAAVKPVQTLPETGPDDRRFAWLKLVIGLAAVAAGVTTARYFGAFEFLSVDNIDHLNAWFNGLGWWAPLAFVVLSFIPGWVRKSASSAVLDDDSSQ